MHDFMGGEHDCEGRLEAMTPGLVCEIVNSVGQGNYTLVREKSWKSQEIQKSHDCCTSLIVRKDIKI